MKVAIVVCAALACVSGAAIYPATTYVHAPQYDSALIKSDRLGGNFAYSTVEAKAYAAITPVVQNVVTPVGISYHATPIQYPAFGPVYAAAYPQPAYVAAAPAVVHAPIFSAPIGPIAAAPIAAAPIDAAPIYPAATPILGPADEAIAAPGPLPEGPLPVPIADAVESAASSDDSVTIEAA